MPAGATRRHWRARSQSGARAPPSAAGFATLRARAARLEQHGLELAAQRRRWSCWRRRCCAAAAPAASASVRGGSASAPRCAACARTSWLADRRADGEDALSTGGCGRVRALAAPAAPRRRARDAGNDLAADTLLERRTRRAAADGLRLWRLRAAAASVAARASREAFARWVLISRLRRSLALAAAHRRLSGHLLLGMPIPRPPAAPPARPPARRRRLITAAGRVGGAMAERAAAARAAALRAACFRWAASADERCGARGAHTRGAAATAWLVRRWLGGARFMRRRRCVEALEFSACAPYGAAVRRLRQRSGWAQWAARARRRRPRPAACPCGSRRSQLRRGFRCARGGCDWLAASESATAAESLRRALGFDAGGAPARGGTRSASGWRRAPPAGDADAAARALEVWTQAMTPRTEVGSCCCSGACTGRRLRSGAGASGTAKAARGATSIGAGWRYVISCGRR